MKLDNLRRRKPPAQSIPAYQLVLFLALLVVIGLVAGPSFGTLQTAIGLVSLAFLGWCAFHFWRKRDQ
jgi:hypothetical protein